MGLDTHGDNEERIGHIETLNEMTLQSREALTNGMPFYHVESNPLGVAADWRRKGEDPQRVITQIPWRGFRTERSPREYQQKLTLDPLDFIEATTRSEEPPHIVLELGPGVGRFLHQATRAIPKHDELRKRQIHIYGECDQFWFKLSSIIRNFLNYRIDELIKNFYTDEKIDAVKREFVAVLVLYISQDVNLMEILKNDTQRGVECILRDNEPWIGLIDEMEKGAIPDISREFEQRPYRPESQMMGIFSEFAQNPRQFFRESSHSVNENPRRSFDIVSDRIILGGDMQDFLGTFPDESISTALGVRSTIYIVESEERTRGIVPFGMEMARKLRPGGGWLDDWPRGNYDAKHYTKELETLAQTLRTDMKCKDRVKLLTIWGPSEEYPDQYPVVPVAMMMVKKDRDGHLPIKGIEGKLIRTIMHNGVLRPVTYTLVEVQDGIDSKYRHTLHDDPLLERRKTFERRLQRMLEDMKKP